MGKPPARDPADAGVQMALSLLAASGGLLYYYLNKDDRDRNRSYGALLVISASAVATARSTNHADPLSSICNFAPDDHSIECQRMLMRRSTSSCTEVVLD